MVDFEIIYIIEKINGDYAYCRSESGSCTNIALALLPDDIDEGPLSGLGLVDSHWCQVSLPAVEEYSRVTGKVPKYLIVIVSEYVA